MNLMHLIPHHFDLNLLSVFYALFKYRNVSRAADSLFISASAFSHALNRLRAAIGDPLFIRLNGEMQPTQKAEELAPIIIASLELLSVNMFQEDQFDFQNSSHEFSIATTEYTAFSVLPHLIERCRQRAPNIKLKIIYEHKKNSLHQLELGKI